MAAKSLIESPASSSEEESSSQEDHELKKRELDPESEESYEEYSEEEECHALGDSNTKPKPVSKNTTEKAQEEDPKPVSKNTTEKAQEEDDSGSEETDSEDEESGEDSDPKPKPVSEILTEKVQEEDEVGSEESEYEEEESDSEEEESKKKSCDAKPINKESKSEMASSSANSTKNKTDGGISKNDFFRRLWSLEDEKILLNSMLQFRLEKGKEVDSSSLGIFCDYLKGSLSFTDKPECKQVSRKIKVLKKKYSAGTSFTKEHDLNMKEIASQVWEIDVKNKSLKRKFSSLEEEVGKLKSFSLKKKLKTGDNVEKAGALEEKIQKQKTLEMKQELKRIDLIRESFKLVLEGIQKR